MTGQNQFPGGNPQYPQGGQPQPGGQYPQPGGQQYPQQGGPYPHQGQPSPQGGQPPYPQQPQPGGQQYPQPAGQPSPHGQPTPQGGQPPHPQQGGQPQYPQLGGQPSPQPGQPYPSTGGPGYPGAGQYPPAAGAYGPGQWGGGYQPQPPKPKGNGMVLGIVAAGLVAVMLAGWLLMSLFSGGGEPTPTPTPQPSVTTEPDPQPTPTTPTPTPTPDPGTTSPQPGGAGEVGLGIVCTPASGWTQFKRDEIKNYTEFTNGRVLLVTQALRMQGQQTGKDVVDAYLKQITATLTNVRVLEAPRTIDVNSGRLSAGLASWSGTRSTSQGSVQVQYVSIISVRDDGLTVMSTLILPQGVTLSSVQADYQSMTNSMLNSQLRA